MWVPTIKNNTAASYKVFFSKEEADAVCKRGGMSENEGFFIMKDEHDRFFIECRDEETGEVLGKI